MASSNTCSSLVFVGVLEIIQFSAPLSDTMEIVVFYLANPSILSPIGCRLLMNMKEAGEHGVNVGTNWDSYTHSAMRFEESLLVDSDTEFVTSLIYAII